jgi:3-hydroxybutyryl-CoA dehydrogenase
VSGSPATDSDPAPIENQEVAVTDGTSTREITTVAAVGSGYMGGGIAQVLALSGKDVVLGDVDRPTAAAARDRLLAQAEAFASAGLFPEHAPTTLAERLAVADSIEDAAAAAQYVTEAVPESPEIKDATLRRVSAAADPGTIIGTNTSAIPIGRLAESVRHPERFLGVHWMNPAPFVPGVEIIAHATTRPDVVAAAESLVRAAGKVTARVADTPGFVANRLQFALYKEAVKVVEEGLATPDQVDLVVSNAFGFRLALFGPFAIGDMAGLDVYAASYRTLAAQYGERFEAPAALTELVEAGNLGLKTGKGFLDIDEAAKDDLVAYRDRAYQRLSALRAELGQAPGLRG